MYSKQVGVTPKLVGNVQRFQRAAEIWNGRCSSIPTAPTGQVGCLDESRTIPESRGWCGFGENVGQGGRQA